MNRGELISKAYKLVDSNSDLSGITFNLSNLSAGSDESSYAAEDLNSALVRNGFGNEYHFNTLADFSTRYVQLIREAATNQRSMNPGEFGYKFQRISVNTAYDDTRQTSGWKTLRHSMVRIEANSRGSGVNSSATGEAAVLTLKIRVGQKGTQIETYPVEVVLGDTGCQEDIDYIKRMIVDPFNNVVRNQFNPTEIAAHVYQLVTTRLNGIPLRDRGGIYFVPGPNCRSLIKIIESICSVVGRIHPIIIPISGSDEISKGSIAETVNSNIVSELEKLIDEVDKYSNSIVSGELKNPRLTTIMSNLEQAAEMKKRAQQHALALEFETAVFDARFKEFINVYQKSQNIFNKFKDGSLAVGGSTIDADEAPTYAIAALDADNSQDAEEADL